MINLIRNVIALGGIPNKVQVGDMGIDGRIYPVGSKPTEAASKRKKGQTDHMFAEDWFPIQVKQQHKVGRPDIDQFEAIMERENRQRGFRSCHPMRCRSALRFTSERAGSSSC